jgi:hypothetical protein
MSIEFKSFSGGTDVALEHVKDNHRHFFLYT